MPESGFFARIVGLVIALTLVVGPFHRSFAKNHSPLPEVIMLDDEVEEILPPTPKKNGAQAKPTPTPDPIEEEDQDADAEASKAPDLDRIPVADEPMTPPKRGGASAEAVTPAHAPAPARPAPAKVVDEPKAAPVKRAATPPTKPAPTAKSKATEADVFGASGDAQIPQPEVNAAPVEATKPVAVEATKPVAAEAPKSEPTHEKKFSAFTTEVSEAPAVAAPSGGIVVKPKAADAAVDPKSVRDPLAPPIIDDIVIDPAKVPRVLPEKVGTAKPAKKKPKTAKLKKPTQRKAASTAKKTKNVGVFEKAPASNLDENPDAPYRDPSLDQEGEDEVEEYTEPDREPAEEGDVRTFRDTINSVVDFNQQWEVNFVKNGRYRIRGQPNEIFDYQQSGQYLEVQVLESERRIISIQPIKVRFRQIR